MSRAIAIQKQALVLALGVLSLSACASVRPENAFTEQPLPEHRTQSLDELLTLPPPARPLTVAVYSFTDQTGQNKPNDNFSEYSRAVTQGGNAVLINALKRVGDKSWFKVVERSSLPQLLQERQIIRQTRQAYGGDNLPPLPPLLYAGLLVDGGIIGYDSNTLTGGFGARFLGVGGDVKYRRDTVTVYIRAVSVQTGEVLKSVNVSKTIYSAALDGSAFRYIGYKDLLEIEAGVTTNEPATLAVKQAIEKGVHDLVLEGVIDGYWSFRDPDAAARLVPKYLRDRDGAYNVTVIHNPNVAGNGSGAAPVTVAPPPKQTPTPGAEAEEQKVAPSAPNQLPPQSSAPVYVLPGDHSRSPIPPSIQR